MTLVKLALFVERSIKLNLRGSRMNYKGNISWQGEGSQEPVTFG